MKHFFERAGFLFYFLSCMVQIKSQDGKTKFKANEVFNYNKEILFSDNFQSGHFGKWQFSENSNYNQRNIDSKYISIVSAPNLVNKKAVRFVVKRGFNSFRSEISLPYEKGFHERWYGARIYIPEDWIFDTNKGNDIVMQWHAIPGNFRATNPNLAISLKNKSWRVDMHFGDVQNPTAVDTLLSDIKPGKWVALVIHAKWSPNDDGLIEIWKDGQSVFMRQGRNVYHSIGVEYTPYFKTGIYHPTWHITKDRLSEDKNRDRRKRFENEAAIASKTILVTDIKIGSERAKYKSVSPEDVHN